MATRPKLAPKRVLLAVLAFGLIASSCGDSAGDAEAANTSTSRAPRVEDSSDFGQLESEPASEIVVGGTDGPESAREAVATQVSDRGPSVTPGSDGSVVAGADSLTPIDIGRDIIFSAELTIGASDVAAASREALSAIAPVGGLLFGQETTAEPHPKTVLTIRVLPADFQEALSRLGDVGQVRSQSVSADDVTERVVDLRSRIVTSETSVERLRVLLAGSVGLDEVTAIERELLAREQALEQLRGQLRTISDAVGLATIVVTIEQLIATEPEPEVRLAASFYVGDDQARGCPTTHVTEIFEGDIVTACFEVVNVGDSALTDVVVRDRSLLGDQAALPVGQAGFGPLEPGETWIYAATLRATETITTETRVTASVVVTAPDGSTSAEPIAGSNVNTVGVESFFVTADSSLPGLGDSIGAGLSLLRLLMGILVVVVGFAVPFIWLVPLSLLAVWFTNRKQETSQSAAPVPESST